MLGSQNSAIAIQFLLILKAKFKAVGDKLLINKFMRQNFGGGLTLKNFIS